MPPAYVEAGPRVNAETGLGNVIGLGSFDASEFKPLRPNRQLAIAELHHRHHHRDVRRRRGGARLVAGGAALTRSVPVLLLAIKAQLGAIKTFALAPENDLAFLPILAVMRDAVVVLEEELDRRRGVHLHLVHGERR